MYNLFRVSPCFVYLNQYRLLFNICNKLYGKFSANIKAFKARNIKT